MAEPNAAVSSALAAAARATGVSASFLTATARRESGYDADAKAATSSASGLFQFIESTWVETLARHAHRFGLGEDLAASAARVSGGSAEAAERDQVLALRFDPKAAALMAGALARDNADRLKAALGRAPADGELYAAHVLGAGGAARLIDAVAADPEQSATALFPAAANANAGLFRDAGAEVTVRQLLTKLASAWGAPAADGAQDTSATRRPSQPRPLAPPDRSRLWSFRGAPALRLTGPVLAALAMLDAPKRSRDG